MSVNCFKKLHQFLLVLLMCFLIVRVSYAQDADEAKALVKKGSQLIADKKYAEAIDTLNKALKVDSGNVHADYQLAVALNNLNKSADAISHLQKVIKANTNLNEAAYDLLGFTYFKNKQYAEAEQCAVEVLKINPKQAGTVRMYALVSFHQNKRAQALLAFCSFILLEQQTARSTEAFGNIQHILAGGTLKAEPGVIIKPLNADQLALNNVITKVVNENRAKKYASPADLLEAQLKGIFIEIGTLAAKQNGNDFFNMNFANFFYKLAGSEDMHAFTQKIASIKTR